MFKIIGSAEAKYLAATDILIGDMSNINYEFLVFNRPVILLANKWVQEYFPDIGIKTTLKNLDVAITKAINHPNKLEKNRKYWLRKTIYLPQEGASKKSIDIILEIAGINNPRFVLITGNNSVRLTNLRPLFCELEHRGINVELVAKYNRSKNYILGNTIFIAAHFRDLYKIPNEYFCVHIDHDLKAPATANISKAIRDYRKNNYFGNIDLHLTAGIASKYRTEFLLGENKERVVISGYSKADDLLKYKNTDVKKLVCDELCLDYNLPLITYAPANYKKFMKPGGSLSKKALKHLKRLGENSKDINILVKVKYKQESVFKKFILRFFQMVYSNLRYLLYGIEGAEWSIIIDRIKKDEQVSGINL